MSTKNEQNETAMEISLPKSRTNIETGMLFTKKCVCVWGLKVLRNPEEEKQHSDSLTYVL
jgi:hypothetical protein